MSDGALVRIGATTIGSLAIGCAIGSYFSPAIAAGLTLAFGSVGLAIAIREARKNPTAKGGEGE